MAYRITTVDADALWAEYVKDHKPKERDLHALLISRNYFASKAARLLLEAFPSLLNARLVLMYEHGEVQAMAADIILARSQLSEDLQPIMCGCPARADAAAQVLLGQNPSYQDLITIVHHSSEWRSVAWERIDKAALTGEDVYCLVFNHANPDAEGNVATIVRENCEIVLGDGKDIEKLSTILRDGYEDMAEEAARLLLELETPGMALALIVTKVEKYSKDAWRKMKEKTPERDALLEVLISEEVGDVILEEAFALLETLERHLVNVSECIQSDNDWVRQKAIGMAIDYGCVEMELIAVCEYGNSIERVAAASRLLGMKPGSFALSTIRDHVPEFSDVATKQLETVLRSDEESLIARLQEAIVVRNFEK